MGYSESLQKNTTSRTSVTIPFNIPYLTGDETEQAGHAINSRRHCGNHSFGQRCVTLLRERYGFGEVFLTPSCTSALEMGAILAGLEPGDEAIMPSYTFSSTANAVVLRGARPVFCEIEPNTMNIDVERIESLITPKTKLIVPIDYAGIPCEVEAIMQIAGNHGLKVMQDAAQSLHSVHRGGKPCGSVPDLATFSFHETKNINCGEGGALVVNDAELVERAHYLQEKGTDRSLVLKGVKNKYSWVDVGSSFLLADILAAVLLCQLERCEMIVDKRRRVSDAYRKLYTSYHEQGCLLIPQVPSSVQINHHAFFVIFDSEHNQQTFLDSLRKDGISAYIGYVPLHSAPMGRKLGYRPEDLPITEDLASRIVRLPLYADLAEDGLEYCVECMGKVLRQIYGF
jgi:dTDP-4-amino-4,6-dideoxygalactose transaminase